MNFFSWRKLVLDSEMQSTTKLVLFALSTYMNDHGQGCYPSQKLIAQKTSLTERAVRKHIALAIASGFLIKSKRNLKGKQWDSNEYEAAIPMPIPANGREEPYSAQEETREELHSGEGGTIFLDGRNHVPTNSPENSSINSPGAALLFERLKQKHGDAVYKSWFSDLSIEAANEQSIAFGASKPFVAVWIKDHYGNDIQEIIADIWPAVKTISIQVRNECNGKMAV